MGANVTTRASEAGFIYLHMGKSFAVTTQDSCISQVMDSRGWVRQGTSVGVEMGR